MVSAMRAASIGIACDESLAITRSFTPVDEQVLAVDAHAERERAPSRRNTYHLLR